MMVEYVYDGSFDGLLSCIHESYYGELKPDKISPQGEVKGNFLLEKKYIPTDLKKASTVYRAIEEKISYNSLVRVFYGYLSESPDHGMLILRYLQLGFKIGPDVDLNLGNDHVLNMDKVYHRVSRERHRMLGLVRFKNLQGDILYSQVEPDYNIIGLIAPHFKNRLGQENFIIHDLKRGIGVFYNKKEWIIKDIDSANYFIVREVEDEYGSLWKAYFKSITIERKTNSRLQKSNMPMKYWKHLTEKQE